MRGRRRGALTDLDASRAGRRHRGRGRPDAATHRGRQSSFGRRRQYGSHARAPRGRLVHYQGGRARPLASGGAVALLPDGKGDAPGHGRPQKTSDRRAGPREQVDWQNSLAWTSIVKLSATCSWTASFPPAPSIPTNRPTAGSQASRKLACRSKRTRRSPDTSQRSCNATATPKKRPVRPTHLLFNGGVLKAELPSNRLIEVMAGWSGPQAAPKPLDREIRLLDHAVAQGAAYYGWAKQCWRSGRIHGGTARSLLRRHRDAAGLAILGAPRPLRALCVVPIGYGSRD